MPRSRRSERAKPSPIARLTAPESARLKRGARLSVAASLIWPLQALLIAALFAGLLEGTDLISPAVAAIGFFGLALVRAALARGSEQVLFDAADALIGATRARLIERESRFAAPSVGGPGAIAALAGEKLDALEPFLVRYAPSRARVMVIGPLLLGLAFFHSWAVGLVFLIAGPLIPVFMALVGWAAKEASEKHMAEIGTLNDLLVDRLAALADMTLLNAGDRVVDRFAEGSDDLRSRTMAVLRIAFLSSTLLELFAALGVAMVAVWVGFSLLNVIHWGAWGRDLSPFSGIYLLLLAPEFFQPLRDLAAAWHDKAAAEAVAKELDAWEEAAPATIVGTGAPAAPLPGAATVALHGVTAQRGSRQIAYPDLTIAPGQHTAIAGPSGIGKSTLLRLLAGLEAPSEGRIEVAGVTLDDTTADGWRARLGWLPQAPHFLNRSLRHNIAFGAPLQQDALRKAVLEDVVATLPRKDLTVLGETGAGLSGGEGRRVMLARALHAGPDLLLADEPTADLDAATAAQVMDGLMALADNGATLIIATHDPALVARMDQVVTLSPEEEAS